MLRFIDLVGGGTEGARHAARDGVVSGVTLGLLLVGFFGSGGGVALDGLGAGAVSE